MDIVPQILKSGHEISITIQKPGHNTKICLINSTNQPVEMPGESQVGNTAS